MTHIAIIAIGGKHDSGLAAKIADYTDRLGRHGGLQWLLLPHIHGDEAFVRRAESASIATKLKDGDLVILLDERGSQVSSEALAANIQGWEATNKRLVFVIGGAYGVDESLRQRAAFVWSLSQLVFPHQIVRLIVAEQLYRAQMITLGHPYHHQ